MSSMSDVWFLETQPKNDKENTNPKGKQSSQDLVVDQTQQATNHNSSKNNVLGTVDSNKPAKLVIQNSPNNIRVNHYYQSPSHLMKPLAVPTLDLSSLHDGHSHLYNPYHRIPHPPNTYSHGYRRNLTFSNRKFYTPRNNNRGSPRLPLISRKNQLTTRCNPPDSSNFKKAKPLTARSHPEYILLDDPTSHTYQAMLNAWIDQYKSENYGFNSSLLYCKLRLNELNEATSRLEQPCKPRMAIVCDLFSKLCHSPRYAEALVPFKNELLKAIYVDFNESDVLNYQTITTARNNKSSKNSKRNIDVAITGDTNNNVNYFLGQTAYFEKCKRLKQQYNELNRKLSTLEARVQQNTDIDSDNATAKLVEHILTQWRNDRLKTVFRAWRGYLDFKKQRIRELCGKFGSFVVSKPKVFNKWRILAQTSKKEKIELEIFHFRKHLSVVENNLNFYKMKYDEIKKTSSEHIHRLLTDLSQWRSKALKNGTEDDENELTIVPEKILIKWKIYFCNYFQKLIDICLNRLDSILTSQMFYDPQRIIDSVKDIENASFKKITDINDLKKLSGEDVVLNWLNFRFKSENIQVTNFSVDFRNSKLYFMLIALLRPNWINVSKELEEQSLERRANTICALLTRLGTNEGPLIHPHDILQGKSDLNFVMVVRIMLLHPGTKIQKATFEKEFEILERATTRCGKLRRSRKTRDIAGLDRFGQEIYTVMEKIESSIDRMQVHHTQWVDVCARIASGAQVFVTARMRDKPKIVNDEIQKAVKKEFGTVSGIKIADILKKYHKPGKQLEDLRKVLYDTTDEIRKIFTYYALGGEQSDMMSLNDFHQFVADIRVKGRGFTNTHVLKIFEISNLDEEDMDQNVDFLNDDNATAIDTHIEDDDIDDMDDEDGIKPGDGDAGDGDGNFELFDENPDDWLVGSEFVECLVRVANRKFTPRKEPNLAIAYQNLLEQHLRKYACHSNKFRDSIMEPDIQKVFLECRTSLQKIFTYYSKLSAKKMQSEQSKIQIDNGGTLLRPFEFSSMLKDCRLISNTCPQQMVDSVMNKVSKVEYGMMDYKCFCEALASIACLKNPDPFVPFKAKMTIFLSIDLINPLLKGGLMKNSIKR